MSTSHTVKRPLRWRLRDYLSCVYGCKFPLEEEEEEPHALEYSSPQLSHENTIFHPQVDSRFVEEESDGSSWPKEDYITLSFGAGDNIDEANPSSRPISRKGKGKVHVHLNEEWNQGEIGEVNEVRKKRKCKGVSMESTESNQSDSSASSFAFPVLMPCIVGNELGTDGQSCDNA